MSELVPAKLRLRDLLGESLAGLLQRPARTMLTTLGTALGIGAAVAILGLTAMASGQIDSRFTELDATEVVVQDVGPGERPSVDISFPADAAARIERLNGALHAGVWWPIGLENPVISAAPGVAGDSTGLKVVAVEPAMLPVAHPRLLAGRLFDSFHASRAERVALLGKAAAARLGVRRLDGVPAVFIDGIPFTVIGIIDDVERMPDLLVSVIIPSSTALAVYGPPIEPRAEMVIETNVGAAPLVASQAALALRPDQPALFKVMAPPDPQSLREAVTSDLSGLFMLLAAVTLVIGAVSIANTTLVAVLERVNEIGLRRALGAKRVHIAAQFLTESGVLGLLGGAVGSSLGVAIVIGTALTRGWTALLAPWVVLSAPMLGLLVGVLAGMYPAVRAARVEPVDALRR